MVFGTEKFNPSRLEPNRQPSKGSNRNRLLVLFGTPPRTVLVTHFAVPLVPAELAARAHVEVLTSKPSRTIGPKVERRAVPG